MKYLIPLLIFLFLNCSSTKESKPSEVKSPTNSGSGKSYNDLVKQAIDDPEKGSYSEIRISYSETAFYTPYKSPDGIQEMEKLLKANKNEEVIKLTQKHIHNHFAELDLHYYALVAYKNLNKEDGFNWHRFVLNRLINSILKSGDGKSTKTAFVVIAVREEYSFMGLTGIEQEGQHLVNEKGHSYDMFDVKKSEKYNHNKMYFNIDIPLAALSKSLGR